MPHAFPAVDGHTMAYGFEDTAALFGESPVFHTDATRLPMSSHHRPVPAVLVSAGEHAELRACRDIVVALAVALGHANVRLRVRPIPADDGRALIEVGAFAHCDDATIAAMADGVDLGPVLEPLHLLIQVAMLEAIRG